MTWPEPTAFIWGVLAITTLGALLPLDVGRHRQEHIILTITTTAQLAIFGPRGLLLVWVAVGIGLLLTRRARWLLTTACAVTVGFSFAYLTYVVALGRAFPLRLDDRHRAAVALLALAVAWLGTMSVRVLSHRLGPADRSGDGFDPFESPLVPYLLPTVGGAPVVVATVALYRPDEPWPALAVLLWCLPLYAACRFDLHQQNLGRQLRRDAETRRRLAAIGEVTTRIVHQSRHHAGLMGWSIHRLRRLLGDPSSAAVRAAREELDALAAAKQRIQEAFETELPAGRHPATTAVRTRPTDLGTMVREIGDDLAGKARDRNLTVSTAVDEVAGSLAAPAPTLREAVFNILDNALDAAVERVEVTVAADAGHATVTVTDDGAGPPGDEPQQILEPFFTTKADGTGMGLTIADALVAELGGELRLERRSGTTCFVVTVPVAAS